MTNPEAMKKLVPATWSRIRRMQAGSRTANAVNPIQEVMNHAQAERGSRISDIPFARKSSTVGMKLREPSNCPTQKRAIEIAQRTCPVP